MSLKSLLRRLRFLLCRDQDRDPDPLRDPNEAFGALEEHKYKAELDLVERYQAFVAELLRISLLGIAVFGFLYNSIFKNLASSESYWTKKLAALGVIILGFCAGCSLVFRFFATEGARYYIEALRFPCQPDRARYSLDKRHRRIVICVWSKALAAISLALGSILIAIAFYLLVMSAHVPPPKLATP